MENIRDRVNLEPISHTETQKYFTDNLSLALKALWIIMNILA